MLYHNLYVNYLTSPVVFCGLAATAGFIIYLLSTKSSKEKNKSKNGKPKPVKKKKKSQKEVVLQKVSSELSEESSFVVKLPPLSSSFSSLEQQLEKPEVKKVNNSLMRWHHGGNNNASIISSSKSKLKPKTSDEDIKGTRLLDENGKKFPDAWNTVIFFPDTPLSYIELLDDIFQYVKFSEGPTVELLQYLKCARKRICLCLYRFSFTPFARVLERQFQKHNMPIQIIIDQDVYDDLSSRNAVLEGMQKLGIPIRVKKSKCNMHHKFVIIDDEAVLVGSLNWTKNALGKNEEDVTISTNPQHVSKYMERFELLWNKSIEAVPRKLPVHFYKAFE